LKIFNIQCSMLSFQVGFLLRVIQVAFGRELFGSASDILRDCAVSAAVLLWKRFAIASVTGDADLEDAVASAACVPVNPGRISCEYRTNMPSSMGFPWTWDIPLSYNLRV
jgi:hypothetical protein